MPEAIQSLNDDGTSRRLANSLRDAEILIEQGARQGSEVPDEAIRAVLDMRAALAARQVPREVEESFWKQFAALSRQLLPATVEGIQASRSETRGFWHYTWLQLTGRRAADAETTPPAAYVSAFWYMMLAVAVVLAVVTIQMVASYGSALLRDASDLNINQIAVNSRIELLERDIRSLEDRTAQAGITDQDRLRAEGDLAARRAKTQSERNTERNVMEAQVATMSLLGSFNSATNFWFNQKEKDGGKLTDSPFRSIERARIVLLAINGFLLPLWVGLLGATAFILRSLAKDIREHSFSPESRIQYRLRLALGPLAGATVGLLVVPDAVSLAPLLFDPAALTATGSVGSAAAGTATTTSAAAVFPIGPLALPFLVGYSVDFFFSIADRVLESFKFK